MAANVKENVVQKEKVKVPNFFFGGKMPKFHFGFGSSKSSKKDDLNKEAVAVSSGVHSSDFLSSKTDFVQMVKNASPNMSSRSSKFSSNSPEIAKLRKNLLNAQEKHKIEHFSVTATKIPIFRAKIRDSSTVPTLSLQNKFEIPKSSTYASTSAQIEASDQCKSENKNCAKSFMLENQNRDTNDMLPQKSILFENRTKTTHAENFFRPITQPDETRPENISPTISKFETSTLTKPNSSMNTKDFLAAFMAEKGTARPIIQRGLVRERAKVFEQKIENIKESLQTTPRPGSRQLHRPHGDGKLVVPRPTSFVTVPIGQMSTLLPGSQTRGLGPSPSLISGSGAWSSWTGSTPASSTSISGKHSIVTKDLAEQDSDRPVRGLVSIPTAQRSSVAQSQSCGSGVWSSWTASTPASSTSISGPLSHKPTAISGAKGSNSSSYGQSPVTPASNCSFVPYSISSGSGAWSSWSASTPASSTSISATQQAPGPESKDPPVTDTDEKADTFSFRQTVAAQQGFLPMSGSLVWSASRPRVDKSLPEHSLLDSGSSIPKKYHNQMTSSTTSSKGSCKTNSSPMSEGENKANDYFDDDYKDQPDLTINSLHEVSEGPIATGGGEGDAHDLCPDIFSKKSNLEKKRKESSLSASIESLELDDVDNNCNNNNNSNSNNNNSKNNNSDNRQIDDNLTVDKFGSCKELMRPQVMMPISSWKKQNERLLPVTLDDRAKTIPSIYLVQDITSIKSYLHKLKKILQEGDEGINFSPENGISASAKLSLAQSEEEINDLKRQITLLKQQNFDKDRQIEALKRQVSQSKFGNVGVGAGQKSTQTSTTETISSSLFYLPSETLINSSGETSSTGSSPIRPE